MISVYYNQRTGNFRFISIAGKKILWETIYGKDYYDFESVKESLATEAHILLGYL